MIYIYKGTAYKQSPSSDSPWIVSFVAPAEELLSWAGIPRRATEREIGFQRTEDTKRVEKAKAFFDIGANNQSPTALVVGIHPVAHGQKRIVSLQLEPADESSTQRACTLTVDLTESEPLDSVIERIKAQISLRLSTDEEGEEELFEEALTTPDDIADDAYTTAPDTTDSDDDETVNQLTIEDREIEIGRSLLGRFLEKLENPVWCKANEADLREVAKPATIIDGQHRVLGAARCERTIPFTVCAIFDCEWPEQVYQFTVVNYTAKGIPDQFITANAAMSLTKEELNALEQRLVQAGVKVVEYELMRVVNFDSDSPFFSLVNLTEKPALNKIGYKTMVRVAKRWYDGSHNAIKKIITNLYPDIKGKGANARRMERWKDGDWGVFFLAFWQEVNKQYKDEIGANGKPLWEVGSNLLITIVLYELQERFLINLNNQAESYFEPKSADTAFEDLKKAVQKRASELLPYIPGKFFATEWGTKSLSTSAGREVLQTALRELVDSAGKFRYAKSRLVTGIE